MNQFSTTPRYLGSAASYERQARALNVASATTAASAPVLAATAVAVASIPAVPWTQIAGGVIGLAALGLKMGATLKTRGAQALRGDERAVAGYARRAARWSSARRARAAKRLLKSYQRLKRRRETSRRGAKLAIIKLKLAALYGLEANARKDRKHPTVKGEENTTPEVVETNPAADVSLPTDTEDVQIWWYAGGAAAIVGTALVLRSRSGR